MKTYLVATEQILHPETGRPLVQVGQVLTPDQLVALNAEYGVDVVNVVAVVADSRAVASFIAFGGLAT